MEDYYYYRYDEYIDTTAVELEYRLYDMITLRDLKLYCTALSLSVVVQHSTMAIASTRRGMPRDVRFRYEYRDIEIYVCVISQVSPTSYNRLLVLLILVLTVVCTVLLYDTTVCSVVCTVVCRSRRK